MEPQELLDEVLRYKSFIATGGVTLSGGEPLMQAPFVNEFFKLCKEEGLHTALDTSGAFCTDAALAVLDHTDLALLDIKTMDPDLYTRLTGRGQENNLRFLDELEKRGVKTWVRHVVVPGLTDSEEELRALGRLIAPLRTLKGLEVLPYHTMGRAKYDALGLAYPLEGIPPLEQTQAHRARGIILEEIRRVRTGEG